MKTNLRKTKYTAPALEKGLDILELLSRESEGINLSDIASSLGRSVGELFRMLVVLEQRGYVVNQSGSDKYILTLKMFEVSHRTPIIKRLTVTADPIMKRLAFDVEQSCHLVIHYEGKGHVVAQQDAPSARMFSVRLGAEASLINTCSGHLLLAFVDTQEQNRMLDKIPSNHEKYEENQFRNMIDRVKKQGYESIKSAQVDGVQDIGFPIFDYSDQCVAALVMPFLAYLDDSHPVGFEHAKEQVRQAANEISTALGFSPN